MMPTLRTLLVFALLATIDHRSNAATKPHAVFVIGTLHYSPERTMPVFARELERFGFRTTLVTGQGNPEKKTEKVLPSLDLLKEADVAIFFSRFLQLPDREWQPIEDYLLSGRPVIGLRTANHSFRYPKTHERFPWNSGFGRRALGSPYIVHQAGSTAIKVVPDQRKHPILSHVARREWTSPGTLYLARLEPGCLPLVMGTGKGRERFVRRDFGEFRVKEVETAPVAWAWENEWGGKTFYTSLGHPGDFAEESVNRILINAICWSTGHPLPDKEARINTWQIERVDKKKRKQ